MSSILISSNNSKFSHRNVPLRNRKSSRCSLTFIVGIILTGLLLSYVCVVIAVTRRHVLATSNVSEPPSQAGNNPSRRAKKHAKQEAKAHIEAKAEIREIKKKHQTTFGAGVQPDILVPHQDAQQLPIAAVEDPSSEAHPTPDYILTAYLEEPNQEEWEIQPLPIRSTAVEEKLQKQPYPRLNACSKLTQQFPVDDTPTNSDPFLPWIHDVFPTHDGKFIQFVAQNKRRCKSGKHDTDILNFMAPQAALFQSVPVQRVNDRYRLTPYEEADHDGISTRFICRFKPSMQETLSVFNLDYDWTAHRKNYKSTFSADNAGILSIHTSQLIFKCPVPIELQETIKSGRHVKDDWTNLFVDIIPIRTPPRWGPPTQFLPPYYQGFQTDDLEGRFDPVKNWGSNHILPKIIDSGRWENIPICLPSLQQYEIAKNNDKSVDVGDSKNHRLVSCIWASAGYTTRGNRFAINDGQRRLLEWMIYNRKIGFDHFYLYDNSGAFGNDTSLKPIADLLGPDLVTYVPWPSKICNNNPNNVDSPGERSSQYAAEASCQLRFGPHVDWIGQFDIDEYFVPMGTHSTAVQLLDELDKEDIRIVSFGSWRAWPRWAYIDEIQKIEDPKICWSREPCFQVSVPTTNTMLQAYNCDRQPPGQKQKQMPAEKQFYKPSYVTQHFIHYSAATVLSAKNRAEYENDIGSWRPRAFPDPRQRFGNELTEGLMIHTKAVAIQDTAGWERVCHVDNLKLPHKKQGLCRLGVPWPDHIDVTKTSINGTKEGWAYNCYVNQKVEREFVPQLNLEMAKYLPMFDKQASDKI